MAGRLLDDDPELAYAHAQAAVRRAGRVDVVREAAAITAYRTGRYAEALRELRTVRRLNGSDEHLPLLADCERGLGRPERAIAISQEDAARALPPEAQVELAIVVSGARLDLGDPDVLRVVLGAPLYLTTIALFAFAVGTLMRHSAGAIAVVLGFLLVIENVLGGIPWRPLEVIAPFLPSRAGARLLTEQATLDMMDQGSTVATLTAWQGYGVLAAWTVLLLAAAAFLLRRRDA